MSNELVNANQYKTELDYARDVGKLIVKSGKWNKEWNEDTVAVLVLYARDLGIHPVKALMNGFDIIQGKISMKPILMSDMIRKAGHSIQIVQNDAIACILRGKRKDNGDTCEIKFSYEDAKKAKLTGKDNYSTWTSDMLYSRAMGRLARMLFSDVIGGAYTDGEMEDIQSKSKPMDKLEDISYEVEVKDVSEKPIPTSEKPQHKPAESLTIDDLLTELKKVDVYIARSGLEELVNGLCAEKNVTQTDIIRSVLTSDKALEKLKKLVNDYLACFNMPSENEDTEAVA